MACLCKLKLLPCCDVLRICAHLQSQCTELLSTSRSAGNQNCHVMGPVFLLAISATLLFLACTTALNESVNLSPGTAVARVPFELVPSFLSPNGTIVPASSFVLDHERTLHLMGLGADLDTFLHVHPDGYHDAGKGLLAVVLD